MISKEELTKKLHAELISNLSEETIDYKSLSAFNHAIWHNPRNKRVGGWQLTEEGYHLLAETLGYKEYKIDFPQTEEFQITNQTIIWMDRFIDCPYYLEKKAIIVFKEKTAFQLILFSGDIHKFGWSKQQSSKLL
jgi:hypothetical protein